MIPRLYVPLIEAEDVKRHLAKKDLHWKAGYSAQELAFSWTLANGVFPSSVSSVLAGAPEYSGTKIVDAFFERKTNLDTEQAPSQTDLLVVVSLNEGLGILGIEGKVDESFDMPVCKWKDSDGKVRRLEFLCGILGINPANVGDLHYQLLHRTAATVLEAQRYRCHHAFFLVHSFSPKHSRFEDFAAFSRALSIPITGVGQCSAAKICDGVSVRLGWAADIPR